jgi:hypothetical protein
MIKGSINMGMELDILGYEKGGYNKESFIAKLDAYNTLITAMQNGLPNDKAKAELELIHQQPMFREKGGFFGKVGFSVKDTDAYIADLEKGIAKAFK